MKYTVALVLTFFYAFNTYCQQDPQYTQYMYNMAVVNPAYAGSKGHWSLGVLYRNQWTGLKGAPKTASVFGHTSLWEDWGIGASLITDKAGPVSETNAYADIAYRIELAQKHFLSFGVKIGATFHDIGLADLDVFDANDPFFSENINSTTANFGAGLFYYSPKFYAGVSIPNFIEAVHLNSNGVALGSEVQHFFITAGYVFDISEHLALKPSLLIKSAFGAPTSIDLNANARLYDRLELGVSYRTDDAISALINFNITPQLRVGYAYDYITSKLKPFASSSSEIILLLDILPKEKRLKSPRFF